MVVISAAVLSKTKTLVARQFIEMSRIRVEGLLSAFHKLIEAGSSDHTYIETESVRYVYQPMESLYLLLITNKASNILEDLETLRLLSKIVQDSCQSTSTEELVLKNAFDIVFAFDEVISFGYRESVTLTQIRTYTEMDSHEEKLHQLIEQAKIIEAKETAKRKQVELAKQRALQKQQDKEMGALHAAIDHDKQLISETLGGGNEMKDDQSWRMSAPSTNDSMGVAAVGVPKKGMSIGKKKPPASDLLDSLRPQIAAASGVSDSSAAAEVAEPPAAANPLQEPVDVLIEEVVTASLQTDGGVKEIDIGGTFQVTVLDANRASLACFKVPPEDKRFKYRTHPNLNKSSYSQGILELRDASRAFRQNTPGHLVKWRMQTQDEDILPLNVSCWPSSTAEGSVIVVEYQLSDTSAVLTEVEFKIACPQSAQPSVSEVGVGEARTTPDSLHWVVGQIDESNANGTFEFSARGDWTSMMPIVMTAEAERTLTDMQVLECYQQEKKEPLPYSLRKVTKYQIRIGSQ